MNKLFLFILFLMASCSHQSTVFQDVERNPSTIGSQCNELVGYFMEIPGKLIGTSISKEELLNKNVIEVADLEILEWPLLKAELLKKPDEAAKLEVNFILIKKQYNHFTEEQIIKHYRLLEEFCGM
jgi:hypothetical protein